MFDWSVWQTDVSRCDWHYAAAASCYLLAGEVAVTPPAGAPLRLCAGDHVTIAAGLGCVRDIRVPVRKRHVFYVQRRFWQ